MGKKAVGIWMRWSINALMILCTWITALGYWVPRVDPAYHGWMPLIGLAMPGLLVVNVLILIWFIVQRYFLLLLFPLCAIGLNYPYISRMWHPWPAPSVTQAAPPQTYRIMTLNMGGAVGRTAEVVREMEEVLVQQHIDILVLQEANCLEEESVFSMYPYSFIPPQDSFKLKLRVYSRYPILRGALIPFPMSVNDALWCDIALPQDTLRLYNVHMQTTNVNQNQRLIAYIRRHLLWGGDAYAMERLQLTLWGNFSKRAEQARMVRRMQDATSLPMLLCGDFNDTPISYTYNTLRGNRLKDGFLSAGHGWEYTFDRFYHLLRIDFIMHTKELTPWSYAAQKEYAWSDHFPVMMEFSMEN